MNIYSHLKRVDITTCDKEDLGKINKTKIDKTDTILIEFD